MPGMDGGTHGDSAALVLTELILFWTATLLHMHRLLSPGRLPDADHLEDAGHMAMGAGMTVMAFPGVPVNLLRVLAAGFAIPAVVFLGRALCRRGSAQHRIHNSVTGASHAAAAYMLAVPSHPPTWLSTTVAAVLAVCVLVHGWRLVESRLPTRRRGMGRTVAVLPHAGTLVMTAAMAWLVTIA